jgi:hypothetical protein
MRTFNSSDRKKNYIMSNNQEITNFDSLPNGIKKRIMELHFDDYQEWVHESIPALNNQSIISTINTDNGLEKLCEYLLKIESYLGIR